MKLKRIFLYVDHDGPTFTDYHGRYDLCTYDLERRFKKDLVKRNRVIPAYIDLDEFPKYK